MDVKLHPYREVDFRSRPAVGVHPSNDRLRLLPPLYRAADRSSLGDRGFFVDQSRIEGIPEVAVLYGPGIFVVVVDGAVVEQRAILPEEEHFGGALRPVRPSTLSHSSLSLAAVDLLFGSRTGARSPGKPSLRLPRPREPSRGIHFSAGGRHKGGPGCLSSAAE